MRVYPPALLEALQPGLRSMIARGWGSVIQGEVFNAETGMSISET